MAEMDDHNPTRSPDDRRRSRSPTPQRKRSRSPTPQRQRYESPRRDSRIGGGFGGGVGGGARGDRDAPVPSTVIGVFGLSLRTTREELEDLFTKFGTIEKCSVVFDRRTNSSRGFGFINYGTVEEATAARDAMNSTEIDGRRVRVDYSVTQKPHDPTPGSYAGRPTSRDDYRRDRSPHGRRDRSPHSRRDRSPYRSSSRRERSPYRSSRDSYRRHSRSRTRSVSRPRRNARRRSYSRSRSR